MDNWNPMIGQTHIKHVPFWQALLAALAAEAVTILLVVGAVWALAALVLSLERIAS